MNIENREGYPPADALSERIDEIYEMVEGSVVKTNFWTENVELFTRKLLKDPAYREVERKNIPALEKLVGGSEEAGEMDKELKREIESRIEDFLERMEAALRQM